MLQACDVQLAESRQAHALPFMHDHPLQVRVGHNIALVVEHGNFGAGGDAQALGFAGQVVDRNIHADHRFSVNAALRQGQADFTGSEEHVRRRQHSGGLRTGFGEPRACTRVVAVFGFGLGLQQVQRLVVVAPLALHHPALATADTLHQKRRARRRGETLQQLRVTQPAHQQEIAAGVAHVGGTEHAVGI